MSRPNGKSYRNKKHGKLKPVDGEPIVDPAKGLLTEYGFEHRVHRTRNTNKRLRQVRKGTYCKGGSQTERKHARQGLKGLLKEF